MEKLLETMFEQLAEEVTQRVIKRLEDNASNMLNTFKLEVEADRIKDLMPEHVKGFDAAVEELIRNHPVNEDEVTEIVEKALKNTSFSVEVSI